jgi:hypothetical protein
MTGITALNLARAVRLAIWSTSVLALGIVAVLIRMAIPHE